MEKQRRENETGGERNYKHRGRKDGEGVGGWRRWGEEHLRIHLLLDNSQEDLSSALESCEVCGSAHTPPGNWKRRREEREGGRERVR